jgi:hypothetical protein
MLEPKFEDPHIVFRFNSFASRGLLRDHGPPGADEVPPKLSCVTWHMARTICRDDNKVHRSGAPGLKIYVLGLPQQRFSAEQKNTNDESPLAATKISRFAANGR